MVTLEALACGVPVLGTPAGGTRVILARCDESFLLSNGLSHTLAQSVIDCHRRLNAHDGPAGAISRRCRELVEAHDSWDRNIAALDSILAGVRRHIPQRRAVLAR
jgi:glycosyltransferase involved in cell wall biosynthesis